MIYQSEIYVAKIKQMLKTHFANFAQAQSREIRDGYIGKVRKRAPKLKSDNLIGWAALKAVVSYELSRQLCVAA